MKGKFTILGQVWDNHVMNEGVKKLMRDLADSGEDDTLLLWISVGTSDATPDDTTLTALVAEVGPAAKFDIGSFTVNSIYPYDLELNITIPDDEITRPETIKELGIWWGPVGSKELFARAVNSTGVVLGVGQAVPVSYDLNIV